MCGRVQSSLPPTPKPTSLKTTKPPRSRRLTKEQQKLLMADIQQGIASGELDIQDLSKKYKVSAKTVVYWKKKVE